MEPTRIVLLFTACLYLFLQAFVSGDCDLDLTKVNACDPSDDLKVITAIHFNGSCDKSGAAILNIKDTYKLSIDFTPAEDATEPALDVSVEVFSMVIPVPSQGEKNVCTGHGLTCPLKADKKYTFNEVFTVSSPMAISDRIKVKIIWAMVDKANDKKEVFCFKAPVIVQKKPSDEGFLVRFLQALGEDTPSFEVVQ